MTPESTNATNTNNTNTNESEFGGYSIDQLENDLTLFLSPNFDSRYSYTRIPPEVLIRYQLYKHQQLLENHAQHICEIDKEQRQRTQ
jgi:hypothetical protein